MFLVRHGKFGKLLQSPLTDQPSLGSVEKLRAALQTPSTGSQEEFIGNKFGLRTPGLFGKFLQIIVHGLIY